MKGFWRNLVLALLLGFVLRLVFHKPDSFDLFVYPDRNALENSRMLGTFTTAEAARTAAEMWLESYPGGDYEIAKNKKRMVGDVGVYEETFK